MPLSVGVGLAPTRELEDGYPSVSGFAGGGEPDPYWNAYIYGAGESFAAEE